MYKRNCNTKSRQHASAPAKEFWQVGNHWAGDRGFPIFGNPDAAIRYAKRNGISILKVSPVSAKEVEVFLLLGIGRLATVEEIRQ